VEGKVDKGVQSHSQIAGKILPFYYNEGWLQSTIPNYVIQKAMRGLWMFLQNMTNVWGDG
jgi:hypothetical protein